MSPSSSAQQRRRFKRLAEVTLVAAVLAPLAGAAQGQTTGSLAAVHARVKAATVEILVNDRLTGTGWFATPDGLILTAAHVIGAADQRVEIRRSTGDRQAATVEAVDLGKDLALLRLRGEPLPGWTNLQLAPSLPPPGDEVYLLGTPLGNHFVMLRGMMARNGTSFVHVTRFGVYKDRYLEVATVAANVAEGNSGGPWFDRHGRVIGLHCGSTNSRETMLGLAFLVPAACIQRFLDAPGQATTPILGIAVQELWNHAADVVRRFPPRTEGLVITDVQDGGPADDAGLEPGTLLTRIDGQKVALIDRFARILRAKQPGDSIELTLLRPDGGVTRNVSVILVDLETTWNAK